MNPILDFLKTNRNVYAFKTLKKRFKLKNNALARYLNHAHIKRALPSEVGSGKHTLNIWKYDSSPRVSKT